MRCRTDPRWLGFRLAGLISASLCGLGVAGEIREPAVPSPPIFTVAPLELGEITGIIPLGNLNPLGGHVFPTDHIYFDYAGKTGVVVRAPADGAVYAIRDQLHGGAKIELRFNDHLTYYLAHVLPEPAVRIGTTVKAGQPLGRVSGESLLDLGACDSRVRLRGFVSPARYPEPTLHAVSPLALFAEPVKSELLAKVRRDSRDKDGRIDLDQPGKLIGNWFHESLPVPESGAGRPETWARQLAFAYDVHEPQAIRVSIGGTVAPAGLYAVQAGAPDPATIGTGSGLVRYRLAAIDGRSRAAAGEADSVPARGTLLVELVDDETLRVEWFAGREAAAVERFTEAVSRYRR